MYGGWLLMFVILWMPILPLAPPPFFFFKKKGGGGGGGKKVTLDWFLFDLLVIMMFAVSKYIGIPARKMGRCNGCC